MTRIILTTSAIALGASLLFGQSADAGPLDRIEDRLDRWESRIDERHDFGRRDVIEDRLDRLESRADRAGFERPGRIDRIERRSIRRLLHRAHGCIYGLAERLARPAFEQHLKARPTAQPSSPVACWSSDASAYSSPGSSTSIKSCAA